MAKGLLDETLDRLKPESLVHMRPPGVTRQEAMALAAARPPDRAIVNSCRAAYDRHRHAVDSVIFGTAQTSKSARQKNHIAAMHAYKWSSGVAAPQLAAPIFDDALMSDARAAVDKDGNFGVFFVGIQANVDVFIGVEGGVGIGFPISKSGHHSAIWLSYSGVRLSTNIDIGVNINTGIFVEPPAKIAGDYLAAEFSLETAGVELSFGIHMSTDLSTVRGFSIGVGVALSLFPNQAAIAEGKIATGPFHATLAVAQAV